MRGLSTSSMKTMRRLLPLLLIATSCASPQGTSSSGPPPSGDLEVSYEIDSTTLKPREGDLAAVVFRLRNGTSNVVVLRDLVLLRDYMLPGSAAALASWQFAQAGFLNYQPEIDEWEYDRRRKAEKPRPVFNSGMLLPGERLVARARLRLLDMPKDFQFRYFELSPEDVLRKVYWEVRSEKQTRFKHLVGAELDARLRPSPLEDSPSQRLIVYPLDGWIVPSPTGHVLVTPKEVAPLPELKQPERIFFLVDSVGVQKIQVDVEKASLASELGARRWPIVAHEREERLSSKVSVRRADHYLFLGAVDLPRLFSDLRDLKGALDVELTPDGGGILLVTR
jgi:hypothetical protein